MVQFVTRHQVFLISSQIVHSNEPTKLENHRIEKKDFKELYTGGPSAIWESVGISASRGALPWAVFFGSLAMEAGRSSVSRAGEELPGNRMLVFSGPNLQSRLASLFRVLICEV
jgi:hypothetical protein